MRCALIAALFAALVGCGKSLDPTAATVFQQAQQAFDSARSPTDYLLAASLYQKLVDQGMESGAVFYNQGNAYMRGGQRGRAIACYRQAKRYLPRDPRLDANLQFALGNETSRSAKPLMEYVIFWQDWLSYPGKFQLSAAAGSLTLMLGLIGLFHKAAWLRRAAVASLAVTFVLGGSAIYDWYRFERVRHGVVTNREVTARKGNAESYEPALTSPLHEGTEFIVIEPRGNWLLVRLAGGQEGWLKSSEVVTY